jgi:hypothetical protein
MFACMHVRVRVRVRVWVRVHVHVCVRVRTRVCVRVRVRVRVLVCLRASARIACGGMCPWVLIASRFGMLGTVSDFTSDSMNRM